MNEITRKRLAAEDAVKRAQAEAVDAVTEAKEEAAKPVAEADPTPTEAGSDSTSPGSQEEGWVDPVAVTGPRPTESEDLATWKELELIQRGVVIMKLSALIVGLKAQVAALEGQVDNLIKG
jgi:hypothetical protein